MPSSRKTLGVARLNNPQRRGVVVTVEVITGLFAYAWVVGLLLVVSFWFWLIATNEVATMHDAYGGQTNPDIYAEIVGSSLGKMAESFLFPSTVSAEGPFSRTRRYESGTFRTVNLWLPIGELRARARSAFTTRAEGFYKDIDKDAQWE